MRVLQINTVFKTGSTGKIQQNLNDLILEKGYKSFVAYGRGDHVDKNSIRIGQKLDMYMHILGTRLFDKHGLYSRKATIAFIEKIDKLNIDIFHLHNIHGYYLHYPTLFKYLQDKKVVWTLHDCWSFTGHCSHYDFIGCDKWTTVCFQCPQKDRYPSSLVMDASYNNFLLKKKFFTSLNNLTIVTPSKWLASEVQKSFFNKYPIKIIYNGIDLNIFNSKSNSFRKKYMLEDKFIILGVSNIWDDRKGFEYFIKLSQILQKNEKIILIGLNDKQLKILPKNIIGIKKTENIELLVQIYNEVDIFVNPTLEDTFPTTNLESMACGTPVVTFDSGGSLECMDEHTGIVVERGNIQELIKAIYFIYSIGKENFSEACRSRVVNDFDKNKNFIKYIKLYEELF